VGSKF